MIFFDAKTIIMTAPILLVGLNEKISESYKRFFTTKTFKSIITHDKLQYKELHFGERWSKDLKSLKSINIFLTL